MRAQQADLGGKGVVVGDDHATLSRRQVLRGEHAEGGGGTERADVPAIPERPGGVGGVFEQEQSALPAQVADVRQRADVRAVVDVKDRLRAPGECRETGRR